MLSETFIEYRKRKLHEEVEGSSTLQNQTQEVKTQEAAPVQQNDIIKSEIKNEVTNASAKEFVNKYFSQKDSAKDALYILGNDLINAITETLLLKSGPIDQEQSPYFENKEDLILYRKTINDVVKDRMGTAIVKALTQIGVEAGNVYEKLRKPGL